MKTIIILITMFVAQQLIAQKDTTASIIVEVQNVPTQEGNVFFGIYSEETFLKTPPEYSAVNQINNGKVIATFKNIPPGVYALSCFLDTNGNSQMDFEPTGMPKEYYGISGNKFNPYGPPVWSDAKFEVKDETVHLDVKLTR